MCAEAHLTERQRTAVIRLHARLQKSALLSVAIGVGLLPVFVGLGLYGNAALAEELGRGGFLPLAVTLFGYAFIAPLYFLRALGRLRRAAPLARDLEGGRVLVFEGAIASESYEDEDPDVFLLVQAGLLARGDEQRIGVLPESARLVFVGTRDVEPKHALHIAGLADAPNRELRYSLPHEVKRELGSPAGMKRRRLSQAEQRELRAHVGRLLRVPKPLVFATALLAAVLAKTIAGTGTVTSLEQGAMLACVLGFSLLFFAHVRAYRQGRRFEDDLDVGWLLSWETPADEEPCDPRDARALPFGRAEVLPVSHKDWTIDDKPAAWRRVHGRKEGP